MKGGGRGSLGTPCFDGGSTLAPPPHLVHRRSAQFEHCVVVTKDGVDILSKRLASSPPLWWELP